VETDALLTGLLILLSCLILIKCNIIKQVTISMFLTGLIQVLISGYFDLIIISNMVMMCWFMVEMNNIM